MGACISDESTLVQDPRAESQLGEEAEVTQRALTQLPYLWGESKT